MTDSQSWWVSAWWAALCGFSVLNIVMWAFAARSAKPALRRAQVVCCGIVVAGCAFRSLFPRADVQRICLFDTWLSSVAVGRSVATVAEVSMVAQWALYLFEVGRAARSRFTVSVARLLVPIICVAEVFSWYAVLTTNYIGNVVEQSIWTLTATFCLVGLLGSYPRSGGNLRKVAAVGALGCAAYVAFMLSVDIPMYLGRLRADTLAGRPYFSLAEGAYDAAHRWIVTHRFSDWHEEMAWMFFYFTAAVWLNIGLIRAPKFEVDPDEPPKAAG
jgi:hypothetical protein